MAKVIKSLNVTTVKFLTANLSTKEMLENGIQFPGKRKVSKPLLKEIKTFCESCGLVFLEITSVTYDRFKYGMPVETFMEHATLITE